MIRTRTIREAAAYFKERDPNTCLTETAIRTLLRNGAVPCARVGKKYLVAIEALEIYLAGSLSKNTETKTEGASVRFFTIVLQVMACPSSHFSCLLYGARPQNAIHFYANILSKFQKTVWLYCTRSFAPLIAAIRQS